MEGLEWCGGDKGGNIESSGVIYARILIWIVSNAEEEEGAAGDVCDQISAVRPSEHRSKRCHFGAWRRGVLDTSASQTHSLFQAVFVWIDTVLNCLTSLFQIFCQAGYPIRNPKHAARILLCNMRSFEKWSMV